jgi:hypothetical protein
VQCVESTQEIPVKLPTGAVKLSGNHTRPPLVVTMMLGKEVEASKSLTA